MQKKSQQLSIDREEGGERAVLVHINFHRDESSDALPELKELASSAGVDVMGIVTGSRAKPESKYFLGSGKAEEVRDCVAHHEADLVLVNHELTPAQERNLECIVQCRVIDRTGLILDIFSQRAQTFEGKLQVELAQLRHLSSRLVRGWTHLERQKGGIGLRGPGETQLETDRRLISKRIKSINKRLDKVVSQREQSRQARKRAEIPTISLVGYTNAGKSTLFNAMTDSDIYTADQLFATLDPTLRQVQLPHIGKVILADTVGFIRHLPHDLVAAFRATLEETCRANLLLHVIDAIHPAHSEVVKAVDSVLRDISADHVPVLKIFNKIDLFDDMPPRIDRDDNGVPVRVWCSATTGEGFDLLSLAIIELLGDPLVMRQVTLAPGEGELRAKLYRMGVVVSEAVEDNGDIQLRLEMPEWDFDRLFSN